MEIHYVWLGLFLGLVSFIISYAVYPLILRIARVWNIYDKPNARKLQRRPVPVLGGVAVFAGVIITMALFMTVFYVPRYIYLLGAMLVMMVVGVMDDKKGLSVGFRFAVEFLIVIALMFLEHAWIDNLGGLWGIGELNEWISIPLSLIAGIGIINAMNLIDGVDGYSSGYTIVACLLFARVFYMAHMYSMAIMCVTMSGAVFPFLLHNVFGKKTKMYIGDGGTLMVGTLMAANVFAILSKNSEKLVELQNERNISLAALCLSILSIAVFDTVRVMLARILRGSSPFHPDRTHLHHLFIDMGFSPAGTTCSIILMNLLVVVSWAISWYIDASATVQLYVVLAMSFLVTFGFYAFMRVQAKNQTALYLRICCFGSNTHIEQSKAWKWISKFIDDDLFIGGKEDIFE